MMKGAKQLEWAIGLVALTAAAVLLSASASDRPEPQRPNLQGTWKLDEDLTARMRQDDRSQGGAEGFHGGMGRRGGGGGGMGRGGGRRGGGFPGGSPNGESGQPGERERQGEAAPSFAALDELTITQQGGQVTIADKAGNTRVLKTDNSKVRDEKAPGGPVELRASWDKDGILTVQVKPDKGPKRTESYILSNDGKHLYVTLTLDRNGREVKIRRAYDPAPDEKAPAPEGDDDDREVYA
ncbi:MAG TPA: hypothetical protein VIA62_15410 [Thermoanaerobaculia bacterium]|jgi:hypothetical protein|nr:hypothetical protein [Thermoanaerobaculia bacterium]